MSYDIYGNPLRPGYCEAHPDIAEPFPCSICRHKMEIQQNERNQRQAQQQPETPTLRDQFAMAAMQSLVSNDGYNECECIAWGAYAIADAMLAQRNKGTNHDN